MTPSTSTLSSAEREGQCLRLRISSPWRRYLPRTRSRPSVLPVPGRTSVATPHSLSSAVHRLSPFLFRSVADRGRADVLERFVCNSCFLWCHGGRMDRKKPVSASCSTTSRLRSSTWRSSVAHLLLKASRGVQGPPPFLFGRTVLSKSCCAPRPLSPLPSPR
ncbi:hypothetical protein BV20DRAFT_201150 [Pilatotrama ljubarskyi]|nr:hypothetical protein BV20DRAFT_201150 [Pilatotrama ljubarskyi]